MSVESQAIFHAAVELAAIRGRPKLLQGTVGEFETAAKEWLSSLMAVPKKDAPPFLLTEFGLARLLAVKARVLANVPVVFQGVTGCGKTELAEYYARIAGAHFECINVFDGTTPQDILACIREAIKTAGHDRKVVILLDEANAMHSTWVAKELLCDRVILGHRVPENVTFIGTVNPWTRKVNKDQTFGLEYALESHGTGSATQDPSGGLLYDVQRMPESLLALVWDYGLPQNSAATPERMFAGWPFKDTIRLPPSDTFVSEELAFAMSAAHWLVETRLNRYTALTAAFGLTGSDMQGKTTHLPFVRTLIACLFDTAQRNLREQLSGEATVASLRDLRVVRIVDFFMNMCFEQAAVDKAAVDGVAVFELLKKAILTAFVLNFELRLDETRRRNFDAAIAKTWLDVRNRYAGGLHPSFLPAPTIGEVYGAFKSVATALTGYLSFDEGIALNQAMNENVLSLFACIMGSGSARAMIIVGRPGSSKSLSLSALVQATAPTRTDAGAAFFQNGGWTDIDPHVVQCTPQTTADEIKRTAQAAAAYSGKRRPVVVLEEVGIAAASQHHPLRVLHGLIDRGVDYEEVDDDGTKRMKTVHVPVIGISNHALDAAKMTRMRLVQRANPSCDDLCETARLLAARQAQNSAGVEPKWIEPFSKAFATMVLSSDADPTMRWFYGLRDFYAFVSMVQQHTVNPLAKELGRGLGNSSMMDGRHTLCDVDPHLIWWTLQMNFGGLPSADLLQDFVAAVLEAVFGGRIPTQLSQWKHKHQGAGRCDFCARIALYLSFAVKQNNRPVVPVAPALGNAPQKPDQSQGRQHGHRDAQPELKHHTIKDHLRAMYEPTRQHVPCRDLIADEPRSTDTALETIAYCLHRLPEDVARRYRPRNLLLLTRGVTGLTLLFEKKLLPPSAVVVIPKPPDDAARFEDLSHVRRCLAQPVTVVLVRAWHLYEPLYEVLNQHFTVENSGDGENTVTRYFVSLALKTSTMPVEINPDCRIILVEDEARLNELRSPFLNRCIKVKLCYDDALRGQQIALCQELKRFDAITHEGRTASLLDLLVPGFCADTLASLSYFVCREFLQEDQDAEEVLDLAVEWIAACVSSRRLAQVLWNLYEGTDTDSVRSKIETLISKREHSSPCETIQRARKFHLVEDDDDEEEEVEEEDDEDEGDGMFDDIASAADDDNHEANNTDDVTTTSSSSNRSSSAGAGGCSEPRPHVLILTEQRELTGLPALLKEVFETKCSPAPPTDLLKVTDEAELISIIRSSPHAIVSFWADLSAAAGQQDAAAAVERAMRILTAWVRDHSGTARQ